MPALVCLDTRVLTHALPGRIHAVRADQQSTVPVVMTRAAVAAVISRLDGTAAHGRPPVALTWIPASSPKPSRWPSAIPV